jgi:hypothetical protein
VNKVEATHRDKVLKRAATHVGYKALPQNNTVYGSRTGTQTLPWDAPFIRTVFEEEGLRLDAGSRASSLYEEFVASNRVFSDPAAGDIAFFAWGSGLHGDGQTHVALVTDTQHWKAHRRFNTIEATDGQVQEMLRFNTDVVAFGRPSFFPALPQTASVSAPVIKLSNLLSKLDDSQYVPIQQALRDFRGLAAFRFGHWDRQCVSAYASWQRHLGMVRTDGKLELDGLRALGYASGRFTIEA